MTTVEFVLDVHEIDESGRDYAFALSREWLAAALAGTGVDAGGETAGELALSAHKQGADVRLSGTLRAELVTECARCLGQAHVSVDASVVRLMTARGDHFRPEPDEAELTPEDLDRDFFSGERIVLDPIVREQLLLEVPIKPLCADDCTGIAVPRAVAGPVDLAADGSGVDPRLAPLGELMKQLSPSSPSGERDPSKE